MWKHLIFLCVALGFARLYELDLAPYYQRIVDYIEAGHFPLLTNTVIPALILVTITLFIRDSVVLGAMRLLVKCIQEICFFAISLISLGALYWGIWENGNLWQDFQPLLPIPALYLLASFICTNIIDFNQPVIRSLVPYIVMAAASFLIVNLLLI